jgi:uncharacterized protein (TIGR02466 family)
MSVKHVIAHAAFPTLLLSFDDFISEQQRLDILDYSRNGNSKSHPALTHSKGESNYSLVSDVVTEISQQYESCSNLCWEIQDALALYCKEAGWTNVMLSNSWTSTQYPNSELKSHMHPGSIVSGVIYIQSDEKSSPLHLYNPNPYHEFTMMEHSTNYSQNCAVFKPKNAQMILFPSWLKHGSNGVMNQSDERVILSFNSIVRQYK